MSSAIQLTCPRHVHRHLLLYFQWNRGFHTARSLLDTFKIQDEEDFKLKVLKAKKPVIVDFHAGWCGPCKILEPRLNEVMARVKNVDLAKVDVDKLQDLAIAYNVTAIPLVIGFFGGNEVSRFTGLIEADKIQSFIEKLISASKKCKN